MRDPWETDVPIEEVPLEAQSQTVIAKPKINKMSKTNLAVTVPSSNETKKDLSPKNQPPEPGPPNSSLADSNMFSFNRENLLQGVIWAEILGKPLSKRGRF
ncbi:MAG TPA: hypothetical protein DDW50_12145 [Firmicutes bacterium]|jgi:hypothetical protein|nr:hypothetical protein [Bacillota bacterium]